ncbi:MAG: type II toxin-antitoxin system VapC family toxin [Gammaproteobacteria bacterium]|nr:type II toxin-antitoxin system VapC family toxin [Gammaproteobacteria bacterium]
MQVIDTNIVAYLLLQGDRTAAARALFTRDPDWHSDSLVLVEFCNVLATMVRARLLRASQAREALSKAEQILEPRLHPATHDASVAAAEEFGVSVYDARFLVVARALATRLVTEDAKLRRAASALTQSLDQAVR